MTWKKTLRSVSAEGKTITYELPGCPIRIESRKRHIPHANGSGTWSYSSFFVLRGDEVIGEKKTLEEAKRLAEWYVISRGLMEETV